MKTIYFNYKEKFGTLGWITYDQQYERYIWTWKSSDRDGFLLAKLSNEECYTIETVGKRQGFVFLEGNGGICYFNTENLTLHFVGKILDCSNHIDVFLNSA